MTTEQHAPRGKRILPHGHYVSPKICPLVGVVAIPRRKYIPCRQNRTESSCCHQAGRSGTALFSPEILLGRATRQKPETCPVEQESLFFAMAVSGQLCYTDRHQDSRRRSAEAVKRMPQCGSSIEEPRSPLSWTSFCSWDAAKQKNGDLKQDLEKTLLFHFLSSQTITFLCLIQNFKLRFP